MSSSEPSKPFTIRQIVQPTGPSTDETPAAAPEPKPFTLRQVVAPRGPGAAAGPEDAAR